jgi:MYXO-CTERM domain-containing protein
MRRAAVAAFLATGVASAAEPVRRADFPCPGCITVMPSDASSARPVPLLVVLHGDEGSPTAALAPWLRPARDKGVALLAVRCPRAKGCARSWWQWNGDPEWLDAQAAALAEAYPVDRDRQYLSGWSGGASYLARASARLSTRWAAVSLAGGGMPPDDGACPVCPRPTYYLAGDGNPLFELTDRTRGALVACGVPVQWTLLPHRDHGGELTELARRSGDILGLLLEKRATCAASAPAASSSSAPEVAPEASSTAPAASAPATPIVPAIVTQSPRGCGCRAAASPPGAFAWLGLAFGLAIARRSRRNR